MAFACSNIAYGQKADTIRPYYNMGAGIGLGILSEKITTQVQYTTDNWVTSTEKREGYNLKYNTHVFYVNWEGTFKGASYVLELRYLQGEYDAWSSKEFTNTKYLWIDSSRLGSITGFSGTLICGPIANAGKRFQMPIQFVMGFTKISGYPIDRGHIDFGGRVRAKLYITDRICIYGGVMGLIGITGEDSMPGNLAPKPSSSITFVEKQFYVDVGISVMLWRSKKATVSVGGNQPYTIRIDD